MASTDFKPMLAATADGDNLDKLPYPLDASPKLDGIRSIFKDVLLSRSLKPIPNKYTQAVFNEIGRGATGLEDFDGELIVGDPTADDVFRVTTSAVMSIDGEPDAKFYLFDHLPPWRSSKGATANSFERRYEVLQKKFKHIGSDKLVMVPQVRVKGPDDILELESKWLGLGYEGMMLRRPDGGYKYGRSTLNEAYLIKLKRFVKDAEAIVIGYEESMTNKNEAKRNALGQLERSSHKAGKVGAGTLGALIVRDIKTGVEFNIGIFKGFTAAELKAMWAVRKTLIGKIVKYSYFPSGAKDKPRFPVLLGFRDPRDM